jgi:hypothetical protein
VPCRASSANPTASAARPAVENLQAMSFMIPIVDADFAAELGADDETLEFPWQAAGAIRYYDLKRKPELLAEIEEARQAPALAEFLAAVNSPRCAFETAKCDAWFANELNVEEEIYGAACKFASYVDLVFTEKASRRLFSEHERFAQEITRLLTRAPEMPAAAEFLIRRCFFHENDEVREGFYFTFYLSGYGDDEAEARKRWGIALTLAANAIRQWSARTQSSL